jgi:hypothetical protein
MMYLEQQQQQQQQKKMALGARSERKGVGMLIKR